MLFYFVLVLCLVYNSEYFDINTWVFGLGHKMREKFDFADVWINLENLNAGLVSVSH